MSMQDWVWVFAQFLFVQIIRNQCLDFISFFSFGCVKPDQRKISSPFFKLNTQTSNIILQIPNKVANKIGTGY